mmetsp:Transcript_103538/g.302146  ORF Transcript_103538/g.302146 Transcript_103538/m.302146 type:complete len:360 (+) Transcript_103538:38-1117(+)
MAAPRSWAAYWFLGTLQAGAAGATFLRPAGGQKPWSILEGRRPRKARFCLHFNLSWDEVTCERLGWPRANRSRRIIDAFAYNGESDIYEARRRELASVVDGTALVTTVLNFKGVEREPPPPPKGEHIKHTLLGREVFDDCLFENQTMDRECACTVAKNNVADVVEQFDLDPEDWVLFSDPDEIPNREVVRLLRECEVPAGPGYKKLVVHLDAQYHYYYDLRCFNNVSKWDFKNHKTPAAVKVKTMRSFGLRVLQAARPPACVRLGRYNSCTRWLRNRTMYLPCAAWHLTSFGGAEMVKQKHRDNVDYNGHFNATLYNDCTIDHPWRNLTEEPSVRYPEIPHSLEEDPGRFQHFFRSPAA